MKQPLSTDRCPLVSPNEFLKGAWYLPSISLLLSICLSDIPCHPQAKKVRLRTNIHIISISAESSPMFGILNCNTFQRRIVRCCGSAHKLNPTEKLSVRSSVPRNVRLQVYNSEPPAKSFEWQNPGGNMTIVTKENCTG